MPAGIAPVPPLLIDPHVFDIPQADFSNAIPEAARALALAAAELRGYAARLETRTLDLSMQAMTVSGTSADLADARLMLSRSAQIALGAYTVVQTSADLLAARGVLERLDVAVRAGAQARPNSVASEAARPDSAATEPARLSPVPPIPQPSNQFNTPSSPDTFNA
ncbi:hypothetical protein [Achromobacter aloeverae]|nr:hypothetical protein [Achromobacter aloeverae]